MVDQGPASATPLQRLRQAAQSLRQQTLALYLAYRDARTPWYATAWAGLVLAYAFSPLDLIPDFIPVLGYLDDLVLVPAGIALAIKLIPAEVLADSRAATAKAADSPHPVNWYAAAAIIALWLALAWLAIRGLSRLL